MRISQQLSSLKQADLAALFAVTDRTIQRWHDQGLPRHGEGRGTTYVWADVLPWYIASVSGSRGGGDESDKDRKLRAEADLAEMERDREAGKLLDAEEVRTTWAGGLANMRAKLLNLPAKVAVRLEADQTVAEREALLRSEVHEALAELARGGE